MRSKTIYIRETPYLVDTETESLKMTYPPALQFVKEEMEDKGSYNKLLVKTNGSKPTGADIEDGIILSVNLPKEVFTDEFWENQLRINRFNDWSAEYEANLLAVDQKLEERLAGRLNTIEIEGHIFYVDIPMNMLRPENDFLSRGIRFNEIYDYWSVDTTKYHVPYDPVKRQFTEIYMRETEALPDHLVMVEIPSEAILDPVGFARKYDVELVKLIAKRPFTADFKAKRIDFKAAKVEQALTVKPANYGKGPIKVPRNNIHIRRGRGI